LVKGANEILDKETREHFISIKENQFGFEALTDNKRKLKRIFKDKVIIEKPTLEDIMLYVTRRVKNV
jgi:ABC-2 type transport system ATP-binding protein